MAGEKLQNLDPAGALDGADLIYLAQGIGSNSKKGTLVALKDWVYTFLPPYPEPIPGPPGEIPTYLTPVQFTDGDHYGMYKIVWFPTSGSGDKLALSITEDSTTNPSADDGSWIQFDNIFDILTYIMTNWNHA